jgi:type IV pilus assembly protein PilM
MPRVGVSISNSAIRFIEFTNKKERVAVRDFGEIRLPPNVMSDGDILNKGLLIKSLSELKNRASQTFVSFSIPEEKTFIFNIEIPNVEESLIRQSIEFRLEENVPFKANEVDFDYQIIRKPKDPEETIFVSVSAIPKKTISEFTEVFNSAGLVPIDFEVESRAIAESVISKNSKTAMIVNIKDDSTILSIVNKNVVLLTSVIPVGENLIKENLLKIDSSIYKNEKISDKAFALKASYEDETYASVLNIFSILKDEIEKFNYFLISRAANKKSLLPEGIDKIIVSGKGAALPGFTNYISQNFDIEVSIANVWVNVFNLDEQIPNMKFTDSLDFAPVIGSALM